MLSTSQIFLSKSALRHNVSFIKEMIGPDTILSSVVKGNAYGHGIEEYVPMARECGVEHFSVFSADEAYRVYEVLSDPIPIMIMGMIDNSQMEWAIENDMSFFVFEMDRLEKAVELATKLNKKANIHVEIESGMNRTGFSGRSLPTVWRYIKQHLAHLNLQGLCTHFAGAESIANYHRIKKQEGVFKRAGKRMTNLGLKADLQHTACSAAMLRYPKTTMDMVRIGILQYGFFPSQETLMHYLIRKKQQEFPLQRVLSWKSQVMSIKTVKAGEFIGYGTSYLSNSEMTIATVPVGYSQGFGRSLSNRGRVLIHGQRVGVIGTVNMNMMSVDVSHLDNVQKGDEVVIIGQQGDLEISVSSFSDVSNLINYELLTRIPSSIPRIVVE